MEGVESWFFEMLEKNEDTAPLIDVMKYLFYVYTGQDFGVTELDFNLDEYYYSMDFNSFNYASSIGEEFTKGWENNDLRKHLNGEMVNYNQKWVKKCISQDQTKYKCYDDGNNRRNYGFGVCHYTGGEANGVANNHIDYYGEQGIEITEDIYNTVGTENDNYEDASLIDVTVVDYVFSKFYNDWCRKNVLTKLANKGVQATEGQIVCLTDMHYQHGNVNWIEDITVSDGKLDEQAIKKKILGEDETAWQSILDDSNDRKGARYKAYFNEEYYVRGGEQLSLEMYGVPGTEGEVSIDGSECCGGIGWDRTMTPFKVKTYTSSSGKSYYLFKQVSSPWSGITMSGGSSGTIAEVGCCRTSTASALTGYGVKICPGELGRSWSSPTTEITKKGLYAQDNYTKNKNNITNAEKDKVKNHLKSGNPVIIGVHGPKRDGHSDYTKGQHYMCLLDISLDNEQVYLGNPGTSNESKNGWVNFNEVITSMFQYILVSNTPIN